MYSPAHSELLNQDVFTAFFFMPFNTMKMSRDAGSFSKQCDQRVTLCVYYKQEKV